MTAPKFPSLKISKLDAAKRQLETAIRLYFHDGDVVSMHTLTAAAYNVLRDINEKRGSGIKLIKEIMLERIKPEHQKEFIQKLNEAENFFKHADRDHDESLDFSPHVTELLIYDAATAYFILTGENPPVIHIYRVWFRANNLGLFLPDEIEDDVIARHGGDIIRLGRTRFFNEALPLVNKI